jgi:hypothetical protein
MVLVTTLVDALMEDDEDDAVCDEEERAAGINGCCDVAGVTAVSMVERDPEDMTEHSEDEGVGRTDATDPKGVVSVSNASIPVCITFDGVGVNEPDVLSEGNETSVSFAAGVVVATPLATKYMRLSMLMVADFTANDGSRGLMTSGTETKSSGPTGSDCTARL